METNPMNNVLSYDDSLGEALPKLLAIPNEEVLDNPRVDGHVAAEIVEGGVKKARAFEAQLRAQFGEAATARLAFLLILCGACRQAEANVAAADSSRSLEEIHDELRKKYELMEAKAMVVAKEGRIDERKILGVGTLHGYDNAVRSALVFGQVLRENRESLAGAITEAEIDALDAITQRMTTALTLRNQGLDVAPARDIKNRAITLLAQEHDELRRDITWLRWRARDADEIVPSIWSPRTRKSKSDDGPSEPEAPVAEPSPTPSPTPTPTDGGPFAG